MGSGRGNMAVRRRGPWFRVLLALLVFAFSLVGWVSWRGIQSLLGSDFMTVNYIEVEGCLVLPEGEIQQRLSPLMGRALHTVAPDSLELALGDLPRVREVTIQRRLPGTLRCRVVEREPVALWFDGVFSEMDRDGVLLPRFGDLPPDLPIIHASTVIGADSLRALAVLALDALREAAFDLTREVSEVRAEKPGIVYYRNETPTRVILGWSKFGLRAMTYREVFERVSEDGFPKELDLRYRDQVVAREIAATE